LEKIKDLNEFTLQFENVKKGTPELNRPTSGVIILLEVIGQSVAESVPS
jgi:hypothetical protein